MLWGWSHPPTHPSRLASSHAPHPTGLDQAWALMEKRRTARRHGDTERAALGQRIGWHHGWDMVGAVSRDGGNGPFPATLSGLFLPFGVGHPQPWSTASGRERQWLSVPFCSVRRI